jgi:CheY-like chemotaxis protein
VDARKLVLLVEDNDDVRETIAELVSAEGYEVITAVNGALALETLRASSRVPDLILLDLMMPVMSGWQFREQQRHDRLLGAVPVVVLSGAQGPVPPSFGAAAWIRKPISLDVLLSTVLRVCGAPMDAR